MADAPTPAPPPQVGAERNSQILWAKVRERPNPLVSVAFTVPVFLFYQLSAAFLDTRSQVDFVSTVVNKVVEASTPAYVLFTLAIALAMLLTTWVQMKRGKVVETPIKRVLWEAVAAAAVAVGAMGFIAREILHGEASAISMLHVFDKIVVSVGSGFHEELLFRAFFISGAAWAINRLTKKKWKAWQVIWGCAIVSSLLFAAVHHVALYAEPFSWATVSYRVAEGLFFATLYVTRGFAVAVYAHVIYNVVTAFLPI